MNLLVYTMLFPNALQPHFGVFVKERLRLFRDRFGVPISIVAPVPAAPPIGPMRWTQWRDVPAREEIDGFDVQHPRFPSPPGFGDRWRARLMARGTRRALCRAALAAQPTVLDAHYAYPDGVAAAHLRPWVERALGRRLPLVVTARGTDLNLSPQDPGVANQLRWLMGEADHIVCVAEALRTVALELGAAPDRVTTLRNGVDIERFTTGDKLAARAATGLPGEATILLAVGHLIERKGCQPLLEAYARRFERSARAPRLVFVGEGELRGRLEARVAELGLGDQVSLPGSVTPAELPAWYRAADVMILASSREGWPNVVLESLACGTPVLATRVWGTPEILEGCGAGLLVTATEEGLYEGLGRLHELDAPAARPWAEAHTWDATLEGLHEVFERVERERAG